MNKKIFAGPSSRPDLPAAERRRLVLEQTVQRARGAERKAILRVKIGGSVKKRSTRMIRQESDHQLLDRLERMNSEISQEQEILAISRQATAECMNAVRVHLESFLDQSSPGASYEDWILDLQLASVSLTDTTMDARFYVHTRDHLQLWNQKTENPSILGTAARVQRV
jgi:hypothetical protein